MTPADLLPLSSRELRDLIAHAAGIHASRDRGNGEQIAMTLRRIADRVSLKPRKAA